MCPRVSPRVLSCHLENLLHAWNSALERAFQPARPPAYGTEGHRFESCRARFTVRLAEGICGLWRTPRGGNGGGNRATLMVLPLEATDTPGVYRRGSKVRRGLSHRGPSAQAVGRHDGRRPRDQAAAGRRGAGAAARRRGPTLHELSLSWLDRYAGSGRDSVRASTRREYRRLLANFALTYFDREVRVRDLDRAAVQQFVDWLTTRPGRVGRLCDRSIANALTPLRLAQRSPKGSWMPTRPSGSCCRGGERVARGRRASDAF